MSLNFTKLTYVDGETVIPASNLNEIQDAILDLDSNKVEKEQGKGLSTNDYSDTDKSKVDTALQSVPDTYRTAAAQDEIDEAQDEEISDLKIAVSDIDSKNSDSGNYIDINASSGVYINSSNGVIVLDGAVTKASNVITLNNATFRGDRWCFFLTGKTLASFQWSGYYEANCDASYIEPIQEFIIGHLYKVHCNVIEGTYTLNNPIANFSFLGIANRANTYVVNMFDGFVWKCTFIPEIIGAFVRSGTYNCKIAYYIEDITETYNNSVAETKNLLQIFDKITAIGDSLTAGYTASTNPSINSDTAKARGANWPSYIGADIGRTITNLAVGGSSWNNWRYGTGSTDITTANIDTNCYLIALGVNDRIQGNTIGTSADIAENKSNNANSVYGNADFVVRTLHEYNPNAHIFLFTVPISKSDYNEINNAIRHVANLYNYTHCVDLYAGYEQDCECGILRHLLSDGIHYEPIGYRIIANYIETAINTFMLTNYTFFLKAPYEL